MPKNTNTAKLTLYLNNSTVVTDNKAIVADTELLTDLVDGSSFPRRKPTLTHTHRATGQGPTPGDYKQIERRDPKYPDSDKRFLTRSATSAFRQARQGMHREKAINSHSQGRIKLVASIGSTLILLLAMIYALIQSGPEAVETPTETAPQEQPLPTIPAPLGYGLIFDWGDGHGS